MLGYIKPFKPEMKVKEFDVYQSVYCGLCHQLRKDFGILTSVSLSYDLTFIAVLLLALSKDGICFQKCRCAANPLKTKACCVSSPALKTAAALTVLITYYKLKDNLRDPSFFEKIASFFYYPVAALARKRILTEYQTVDTILKELQEKQLKTEAGDSSLDCSAEPSASALGAILASLSPDEAQKEPLSRMGYMLGRWVYIIDAIDDLEKDRKRNAFNPFLLASSLNEENSTAMAADSLRITAGEVQEAYQKLTLYRYTEILSNVLYFGLDSTMNQVLQRKGKRKDGKSLQDS